MILGVAQLVRREAATNTGVGGQMPQDVAGGGARPGSSGGRAGDDAQQRADRQLDAALKPRGGLVPSPWIHADFSALGAPAVAHQDGAAEAVKVASGERERE